MKIEIIDGVAMVYTPYNQEFVKQMNAIGGTKWESSKKCWKAPESAITAIREIMLNIYG